MIWWWFDCAEHFWFGSDRELPRPAQEPAIGSGKPDRKVIDMSAERAKRRRQAMRAP